MPEASSFKLELKSPDNTVFGVEFETLCETCRKSVSNYVRSIAKEIRGKSPEREPVAKQSAPKKGASANAQAKAAGSGSGK